MTMDNATAQSRNFDFITLAIAHKIITHEQAEEVQEILRKEKAAGLPERAPEAVLRELGVIREEEVWAIYKARERLMRDTNSFNEKIGGYEIISKVGEGGLGVVYKARQLSIGRVVALKVLHEKWMGDDEFRKRFLVEARIVGRLSHPNLIQVIDVGRHRNQLYYSMEFVDGDTVEKIIENSPDGQMPVGDALDVIFQVAGALQYLAGRKIVHRDVKPGNIMVTRKGLAKLGDFGFVKSSLDSVLSPDGEILGTPDYISPEAANGERNIDFRSDIYSLGVTFYHMLAGRPPFSGSSSEVLDSHIYHRPPDIAEACPGLPKNVAAIVRKMMEKKPEDRYQTYDALFADLELARREHAPQTQAAPEAERAGYYSELQRKIRFLTIALVALAVGLVAAVGVIAWLLLR